MYEVVNPTTKPALYIAEVWVASPVYLSPDGNWADLEVKGARVRVYPRLHRHLLLALEEPEESEPSEVEGEPKSLRLWIRTGSRAKLRNEACVLRSIIPEPVGEGFLLQAKVWEVIPGEGLLRVRILPNRGGQLQVPFTVTALALPEQLQWVSVGLPVGVSGHLSEDRRLVVVTIEPIQLRPPQGRFARLDASGGELPSSMRGEEGR